MDRRNNVLKLHSWRAASSNVKLVQGREVLFYKPTPKECAACHADR